MNKRKYLVLMLVMLTVVPIMSTAMAYEPCPGFGDLKMFRGHVVDYRESAKLILFNTTVHCVFTSFDPFIREYYYNADNVGIEIQSIRFIIKPPLTKDFVFCIAYSISAPHVAD